MPAPPVHLIIRLPYDRAEVPLADPPRIEWNADKENMLWEVIARSRAADSGGTDWQGLSAHLEVPLQYLLYRAQVRYEEDLRGLQDIRGSLGVTNSSAREAIRPEERPSSAHVLTARSGASRLDSPVYHRTPISSHHRSGSQPNYPGRLTKPRGSVSSLTIPNRRAASHEPLRPASPTSSESSSSSSDLDGVAEEERQQEEQDAVGRRLKELEKMMSSDVLGFARPPRQKSTVDSSTVQLNSLRETTRPAVNPGDSTPTSPPGSIPSIPSPPSEDKSFSNSQDMSSTQATSTPASLPPHSSRGRSQHQPRLGIPLHAHHSQRGSSHGSSASSFSDISDAASVSASALESALMSNIRGGGSRLSMFARSHFGGRGLGH